MFHYGKGCYITTSHWLCHLNNRSKTIFCKWSFCDDPVRWLCRWTSRCVTTNFKYNFFVFFLRNLSFLGDSYQGTPILYFWYQFQPIWAAGSKDITWYNLLIIMAVVVVIAIGRKGELMLFQHDINQKQAVFKIS